MVMEWIWFVIGVLIAFCGCVIQSSEKNINYKQWSFNAENLGHSLIWLGSAISITMILCIMLITGFEFFV